MTHTESGAFQSATELTHFFTVRAPRRRGVSNSLETGSPRPASGSTPWTHGVSSRTLNYTPPNQWRLPRTKPDILCSVPALIPCDSWV
jgi:hypothetical protein